MTENVRKVFDMLGVEPNEKFKLKAVGKEDAVYCLTGNLIGCLFDERGEDYESIVEWLLREALINPETIIKLPKEPKKIGNLKCGDVKDCEDCPFKVIDCGEADDLKIHTYTLFDILNNWYEKYKDQEIYKILKARLDKEVE